MQCSATQNRDYVSSLLINQDVMLLLKHCTVETWVIFSLQHILLLGSGLLTTKTYTRDSVTCLFVTINKKQRYFWINLW